MRRAAHARSQAQGKAQRHLVCRASAPAGAAGDASGSGPSSAAGAAPQGCVTAAHAAVAGNDGVIDGVPATTADHDGDCGCGQPGPCTGDTLAIHAGPASNLRRTAEEPSRTLQGSTVLQPLQSVLAQAEQDTRQALQDRKPVMSRMTSTRAYLVEDAKRARKELRELQRAARRETGRLRPPSRTMPPEVGELLAALRESGQPSTRRALDEFSEARRQVEDEADAEGARARRPTATPNHGQAYAPAST